MSDFEKVTVRQSRPFGPAPTKPEPPAIVRVREDSVPNTISPLELNGRLFLAFACGLWLGTVVTTIIWAASR